jgi:hypothetical protein
MIWKYLNFDARDFSLDLARRFLNLPVSFHIDNNTGELQKVYEK